VLPPTGVRQGVKQSWDKVERWISGKRVQPKGGKACPPCFLYQPCLSTCPSEAGTGGKLESWEKPKVFPAKLGQQVGKKVYERAQSGKVSKSGVRDKL
jgi:hypothetical protein